MKLIPIITAASLMAAQPIHAQELGDLNSYVAGQATQTCKIQKMGYIGYPEMGLIMKRVWNDYLETNPTPDAAAALHEFVFNIPLMQQNHYCKVHWIKAKQTA